MASKKQARITLVGPLSYSVGKYRFQKDRPVVTEDMELVEHIGGDTRFKVEILEAQESLKKDSSAPAKSEAKAEAADSKEEVEEVKAPVKSAAIPSKLARKANDKKESANETD